MLQKIVQNPFLHPIIFTLIPILVVYLHNIKETFFLPMLRPLLFSLLFSFVSLMAFYFLFNRNTKKAGIFTTIWIIIFFGYGHIYLFLTSINLNQIIPIGFNFFLLISFLFTLVLSGGLIYRTNKTLLNLTKILNIAAISIIGLNLVQIIPFEISRFVTGIKLNSYLNDNFNQLVPTNNDASTYPDIYYLVFDRYANQNILKEYLNFDNSNFISQLKSDGFFVAENSYANYPATFLSLSSSLNFSHLNFLPEVLGKKHSDQAVVYNELISNNRITDFLKSVGYDYVHLGSSWKPTSINNSAETNINKFKDFNELETYLYENTILNTIIGKFFGTQIFSGLETLNLKSQNLPFRLEKFKNLPKKDNPSFVFGHFLLPHKPYLFDTNCQQIDFEIVRQTIAEKGYLDQLQCANKTISEIINTIKQTNRPSVIVIQSDEGAFVPTRYFPEGKLPSEGSLDSYKIHSYILNALYLPNKDNYNSLADYKELGITSQSTPVNTFRIILNYYFGTQLPLLEDKSFVFLNDQFPYDFTEITPFLKNSSK